MQGIELRKNWGPILATCIVSLIFPIVSGWTHGWIPSALGVAVTLAAWAIDPLVFAIAIATIALISAVVSPGARIPAHWMPHPLTVWLAIAMVYLVRMELQVRARLAAREADVRAERNMQQEWRAFFDNSPAAILTADGDGRIIMGNRAALKLLGYEQHSIAGQGIAQSVAALATALRIDRKKTLFQNLTGCKGWRPDGEMFVADAWFSIGETPLGTRLGAVIVDASERLQERARGDLRSSMATSQIAMGAVLHEIRNLSSAARLMYNNLAHAEAGHLGELKDNADFEGLGTLLKTLAALAAAELRPGESSHSSVNLVEVFSQLRMVIDPWFLESEITVKWDIDLDLPEVWGDESGLLQLFLNLAQNSNKAMISSERRQLTIDARVQGEWVHVRFLDTGPGVPNPEELFEPFRRGTAVKGLGLFVSRAIAHSFHGELKYTPVETGACFTVQLVPLLEWQKVTGAS